ncbi:MAG: DUF4347 domain-containing protein [Nitrosomonas sp.]
MTTKNIFIIDSRVADYQSLITGLPADSEAFVLNPDQDGIAQMQAILANYIATANSQQPTANSQQPTANSQQPTRFHPDHFAWRARRALSRQYPA